MSKIDTDSEYERLNKVKDALDGGSPLILELARRLIQEKMALSRLTEPRFCGRCERASDELLLKIVDGADWPDVKDEMEQWEEVWRSR